MKEGPDISHTAALIGDPARANILTALMDGRALTASELAAEAGVTLPTTSGHLSKLEGADLIQHRKSGRHKYFHLADGDVAAVLEALMGLAANRGGRRVRTGPKDQQMRQARVCYNHLAGAMGVQMFQSLVGQGVLLEDGEDVRLTPKGREFATGFGIDVPALETARAPMCRSCLDWSERRTHLAGTLGRALLTRMIETGWAQREEGSRVVTFSKSGRAAFDAAFQLGS